MGKLYIVPTPVGNLEDMTFRAITVLKRVALIAAEDTRVSGKLLKHFEIDKPMTSYFEHNEVTKIDMLLKKLEEADVALISDAGTPGISDPGYKLIRAALEANFEVVPLPGATAIIPALVASGLPTDSFVFLGFLSKKTSQLQKQLEEYRHSSLTLILYESSYRLFETLSAARKVLGNRYVCISRELSKKFETFYRTDLDGAVEFFGQKRVPGEIVIVIGGKRKADLVWDDKQILKALTAELNQGLGLSIAAKNVADISGKRKGDIYQLGLELQKK